jgi:hypothetical protein
MMEGSEFEFRQGQKFSHLDFLQIGPESHPASSLMGNGDPFLRGKADNSSPSSTEIKKTWIYTFTPHYTFND